MAIASSRCLRGRLVSQPFYDSVHRVQVFGDDDRGLPVVYELAGAQCDRPYPN